MKPEVIVPIVAIAELLAWAVGFVSGVLWLMGRYEKRTRR